ncbi:hypothetical protein IWW45_008695 [Coemansia sp. RSA 485]|nr:hypothetical protein IWW45_008695 [Coemansia sp. RSA 485]
MNGRDKLQPGAQSSVPKSAVGAQDSDKDADDGVHITAAIAAMCNDFDQLSSRQRTASWVSSELSSTKEALGEDRKTSTSAVASSDRGGTVEASRRQHVRLTTIDPITASINDAIKSYRESIDSRGASSDLDPGKCTSSRLIHEDERN